MILLQRWSGRIMFEPVGKIFSTRTHYFWKKMSVQNKNLKFLSLVFWKFNLSKLIFFFSNFHYDIKRRETSKELFRVYSETCSKKDWTLANIQ